MTIFTLDKESLERVNKNRQIPIQMDLFDGFKTAVKNNQPILAMSYLQYILEIVEEKFVEQSEKKVESEKQVKKVTKSAEE